MDPLVPSVIASVTEMVTQWSLLGLGSPATPCQQTQQNAWCMPASVLNMHPLGTKWQMHLLAWVVYCTGGWDPGMAPKATWALVWPHKKDKFENVVKHWF